VANKLFDFLDFLFGPGSSGIPCARNNAQLLRVRGDIRPEPASMILSLFILCSELLYWDTQKHRFAFVFFLYRNEIFGVGEIFI